MDRTPTGAPKPKEPPLAFRAFANTNSVVFSCPPRRLSRKSASVGAFWGKACSIFPAPRRPSFPKCGAPHQPRSATRNARRTPSRARTSDTNVVSSSALPLLVVLRHTISQEKPACDAVRRLLTPLRPREDDIPGGTRSGEPASLCRGVRSCVPQARPRTAGGPREW